MTPPPPPRRPPPSCRATMRMWPRSSLLLATMSAAAFVARACQRSRPSAGDLRRQMGKIVRTRRSRRAAAAAAFPWPDTGSLTQA